MHRILIGLALAAIATAASAQQPNTPYGLPVNAPQPVTPTQTDPYAWRQIQGAALAIRAGADGTPWVIGNEPGPTGHSIYRWTGTAWIRLPGYAERVAADAKGNAWTVDNKNQIYQYTGGQPTLVPGLSATDIAVGGDGTVWALATNGVVNRRAPNGSWQAIPGTPAVRIAVSNASRVVALDSAHAIRVWNGAQWIQLPGQAIDIAYGIHGELFSVDPTGQIYEWFNQTTPVKVMSAQLVVDKPGAPTPFGAPAIPPMHGVITGSMAITGPLAGIAVDADGNPWGVSQGSYKIWRSGHVTRAMLDKWIMKYAPVAHFNEAEKFFPTSAESYLSVAQAATDDGGHPGLALRDTSDRAKAGNPGAARLYVNAKVGTTTTDLQYWFLYAYNGPGTASWKLTNPAKDIPLGVSLMGPCGQHEGDWEHLTIRVDNFTGDMAAGYLAQHELGIWFAPDQVNMTGGRVTVFPSKYGHASYWHQSLNYTNHVSAPSPLVAVDIDFRLVNDTDHPRQAWDTRANNGPLLIGVQGAPQVAATVIPQPWMKYTGRWGRVYKGDVTAARNLLKNDLGSVAGQLVAGLGGADLIDFIMDKAGLKEECLQEYGPSPPWSKDSWTAVDN